MGPDGKVYIADTGNNRIVRVDGGFLTTVVAGQELSGIGFGNLLANSGAETPQTTAGTVPGWTGWTTSSVWDAITRDPLNPTRPEPIDGDWYLRAGATATDRLVQKVNVSAYIAAGITNFKFNGFVSSLDQGPNSDQAEIAIQFRGAGSALISQWVFGPIASPGAWTRVQAFLTAPAGTLSIWVNLISTREAGAGDDAYYDGLSLRADPSFNDWGDGGPAINGTLDRPCGITFGTDGALYIADSNHDSIRRAVIGGNITSIGISTPGYVDGANNVAEFNFPVDVTAEPGMNTLLVADFLNNEVRAVTNANFVFPQLPQTATIWPFFGNSTSFPSGISTSDGHRIWLADRSNFRVLSTVVAPLGSGRGFADALNPDPNQPPFALYGRTQGIASAGVLHGSYNAFVADLSNHAIRHIDESEAVQTVVGGQYGNSGDNGPGYAAQLGEPTALAYIPASNTLLIADSEFNRVRALNCAVFDQCAGTGLGCPSMPPPSVANLNDGNACTADKCWWTNGEVTHYAASPGTACSDGNLCNGFEVCSGTVCSPGTPVAAGTSCSDGNACNGAETCDANHICQPGSLPLLDDGNSCTADACSATGGVTHIPVATATPCSVNDPCKDPGTCLNGACNAPATKLDTSNPCITETCSSPAGIVRTFVTGACPGGTCSAGICVTSGGIAESAVDNTVPPTSSALFASIYGTGGVQTGATVGTAPGQLNPDHAAHVYGVVATSAGAGLSGVTVVILNHTESGQTLSRADGKYDIVANGGGPLVVRFTKTGYLPVDRQSSPSWGGGAHIPDVVMLAVDPAATTVPINSATFQAAANTTTTATMDSRGQRQTVIAFPAGTTATATDLTGVATPLTSMTVHATEFTVGSSTQALAHMPAPLPGASLYTYAADFSVEQAPNAASVTFNQPVFSYVDNFLGLPTGTAVPDGYYDRNKTAWVAEDNGIVMAIVGYNAAGAEIDITGDGNDNAADQTIWGQMPAGEGITPGERLLLASRYPGATLASPKSLWRVPLKHFSVHDFNWGGGPDCNNSVTPPQCPGFNGTISQGADAPVAGSCEKSGSIIGAEEQSLGESLPVMGTPYTLEYRSSYTLGYLPSHGAEVDFPPISGWLTPKRYEVSLDTPSGFWKLVSDQISKHYLSWDGTDGSGRRINGSQLATFGATGVYTADYKTTGHFGDSSEADSVSVAGYTTDLATAPEVRFTRSFTKVLSAWGADALGLGGWMLSPMHVYDTTAGVLYQGDGKRRDLHNEPVVQWIAGNGTTTNAVAGGVATATGIQLNSPIHSPGLVVAPTGDLYFWSLSNANATSTLRRIDALTHNVSDVVNFGTDTLTNSAYVPAHMVLSPNAQFLYVAARGRILRVNLTGTAAVQIFAGTGVHQAATVDGPANVATFFDAEGISVAADGTLYVADSTIIRKIATDDAHTVTTIVGKNHKYLCDPTSGPSANGGAANDVQLLASTGAMAPAIAADGSLYIASGGDIVRVSPQGVVSCLSASGNTVGALTIAADQTVYWGSTGFGGSSTQYSIQKLLPDGTSTAVAGGALAGGGGCGQPVNPAGTVTSTRAATAQVCFVEAMAPGPDGSLYFTNEMSSGTSVFRLAMPLSNGGAGCAIALPSEDGTQQFCFDTTGRHLSTRDAVTGVTLLTFNYTSGGLLSSIVDATAPTATNTTAITPGSASTPVVITGPFGQTTKIGLDSAGKYATYIDDATSQRTAVSHDANGLLLSMTDRNSQPHNFYYDYLGRLKRDADPAGGYQVLSRTDVSTGNYQVSDLTALGQTSGYQVSVDTQGNETRTVTLPDTSQNTSTLDPTGGTTTTYADGTIVTETTQPDALWPSYLPYPSTSTTKLPSGLTRTITTAAKTITYQSGVTPPAIAKLVESQTNTSLGTPPLTRSFDNSTSTYTVTTPGQRVVTVGVDGFNRPMKVTAPGVDPVSYQYDHGRISQVAQGTRTFTMVPYPSTGSSTPGWPKTITVTDRSGAINTIIVPDNAGRPLSSTTSYVSGSTAARETDSTWDGEGNLLTVTPPSSLAVSSRPVHTQTYTPVNLLQSYTPPAVASVPNSTTTFFYNADRGLEYVRQPGGRGVDYVYTQSNGQLVGILADGGTNASFTYYTTNFYAGGANGRLQTATRGATTVTFTYDGALGAGQVTAGGVNGSVTWAHDADFRVSGETVSPAPTPTGLGTASYMYDADGLPTCASLSAPLTKCIPSASTMVLTPSPTTGALTSTSLGVVTETYTPNEYGEPASYTATAGSTVVSFVYDDGSATLSRDGFGRVYHQTESVTGYPTVTTDYRYDEQGRLSKVLLGGALTRQYGYDYNGNRTSVDLAGDVIATYDNQDRMLTYSTMSYGYGPNGERSTRTNSADGSVDQYQYDAVGNLVHITRGDDVAIDYVVDALNRRIAKNKNGSPYAQYVYRNGLNPVAVLTGSGTLAARFVYASRPNTPDFMVLANGAVYKFVNDQRGSPHAIVNASTGVVAKLMTYDEFGNQTIMMDTGVIPAWMQPFGFAGGLYDEDTGLTRFGARDYEAATGRWLAKDPILFGGGQANLYTYVGSDPVNRIDPTGLYWTDANGARNWDEWETQRILAEQIAAFAPSSRFSICGQAFTEGGFYGGRFDFKFSPFFKDDYFWVPGVGRMNAATFGNYFAGYVYQTALTGNLFPNAGRDLALWGGRLTHPGGDDDANSVEAINRGAWDANAYFGTNPWPGAGGN